MKNLLVLLLAVVFASCSQDQVESVNPELGASLSVLEGGLLSYKDDASFIKEYSKLSELKSKKEIQSWISQKGHASLLNALDSSEEIQDSIIDETVVYSDALKAIVNIDSKFKLNGKIVWLNKRNLYLLSDKDFDKNSQELKTQIKDLKVYGSILSKSNFNDNSTISSRIIIPNENKSKEWGISYSLAGRDRRIRLILFNETIVLNNITSSSKMFIKCIKEGKYCSFWKCSWNQEYEPITLDLGIISIVGSNWVVNPSLYYYGNRTFVSANNSTILIASAQFGSQYTAPGNFSINTFASVITLNGSSPIQYIWNNISISWY